MEKIWPALEHVDSSSGALGSAVNKTLGDLIPIVIEASADEKTRNSWLDRLWQAMEDDGVDYLTPVGDRWGELCGSPEAAGRWADELVSTLCQWHKSWYRRAQYQHGAPVPCNASRAVHGIGDYA
jgi:hypothetical protein